MKRRPKRPPSHGRGDEWILDLSFTLDHALTADEDGAFVGSLHREVLDRRHLMIIGGGDDEWTATIASRRGGHSVTLGDRRAITAWLAGQPTVISHQVAEIRTADEAERALHDSLRRQSEGGAWGRRRPR